MKLARNVTAREIGDNRIRFWLGNPKETSRNIKMDLRVRELGWSGLVSSWAVV